MTSGENQASREQALRKIIEAFEGTARALTEAGKPGIRPFPGSSGTPRSVDGWEVEFGPRDPSVKEPDLRLSKPDCRCHQRGRWLTGIFGIWYLGRLVLTEDWSIAAKRQSGFTDYDKHQWRWEVKSFQDYAEDLLSDRAMWVCECAATRTEAQISEHANAVEYQRYVAEIVGVIDAGLTAMAAAHLSRLDKTLRNHEARRAALAQIVAAIEETYAALVATTPPTAVRPHERHHETIDGWRVPIDWSALSVPVPTITSRPLTDRLGNWTLPQDDSRRYFGHVALTADGNVAVSQQILYVPWTIKPPAEYAAWMLQDWMTWWSHTYQPTSYAIADHTEPEEYVPYLQAVTTLLATAFRALRP